MKLLFDYMSYVTALFIINLRKIGIGVYLYVRKFYKVVRYLNPS